MTHSQETVCGLISKLRHRRLIADPSTLQYSVYYDGSGFKPVAFSSTLFDLGVTSLSTLHVRFSVCGGASSGRSC